MNATERSIVEQFPFWEQAPAPEVTADRSKRHVVIGCGTSFYLAQSVAALMNRAGIDALAVPGSEWLLRPRTCVADEAEVVVVALSRSGESTEVVRAARRSREAGLEVIGITCEAGSSLAQVSSTVLSAKTHPEEGIVMTSSASLMVLLALRFIGLAVDGEASRLARRVMEELDAGLQPLLAGRSHFVFLGSGPLYGIAQEGALKLQEMSLTYTQAYHPMEHRHGPVSLVDERTLVVILYSSEMQDEEPKLARELQAKGARVIGIGGPGDLAIAVDAAEELRGLIALPALQILGERVAASKAIDSTAPRHLTKVVLVA